MARWYLCPTCLAKVGWLHRIDGRCINCFPLLALPIPHTDNSPGVSAEHVSALHRLFLQGTLGAYCDNVLVERTKG